MADTMDAMLSERPYRGIISPEEVVAELERETGRQFDPLVSEAARRLIVKGSLKLGVSAYSQYTAGADKDGKHASP